MYKILLFLTFAPITFVTSRTQLFDAGNVFQNYIKLEKFIDNYLNSTQRAGDWYDKNTNYRKINNTFNILCPRGLSPVVLFFFLLLNKSC